MHTGSLNLTVTSPIQTFSEPLTLAEVQVWLGVPVLSPVDAESDTLISALISAAREQAEVLQGRDLIEKQWTLTLETFPPVVELRPPLVSVQSVTYKDSDGTTHTLAENTDYIVDTSKHPGIIMPPYGESWPSFTGWPTSPITIAFTSGFASTAAFWNEAGARVKLGMKMLISAWFNRRLPFEPSNIGISEMPFTVTALPSTGSLRVPR